MASAKDVIKMIADNEVKFVDLRFTDTRGKEQHVSVPAAMVDDDKFEAGHALTAPPLQVGRVLKPPTCCSCPTPTRQFSIPFAKSRRLTLPAT